ncbi:hypothetical protein E4T48_08376 [Aureobasidium sp. EXF-10727]|nr:hypothetical protein E4T48_08376 [Aureobasidium sp. EXF-10727]
MVRNTGIVLLLVALCTLLFVTPILAESEIDWQMARYSCLRKDARIVNAIDRLCNKNLHIPGSTAQLGEHFDNKNIVAVLVNPMCWTDGRINAQSNVWIPKYWCERQFWKVCAQGNGAGRGNQMFGGRGCQSFWITDNKW